MPLDRVSWSLGFFAINIDVPPQSLFWLIRFLFPLPLFGFSFTLTFHFLLPRRQSHRRPQHGSDSPPPPRGRARSLTGHPLLLLSARDAICPGSEARTGAAPAPRAWEGGPPTPPWGLVATGLVEILPLPSAPPLPLQPHASAAGTAEWKGFRVPQCVFFFSPK